MSTVRFGAQCDRCHVTHNDYSVEDIAACEDCERDLCDNCAEETEHETREDGDGRRTRNCPDVEVL